MTALAYDSEMVLCVPSYMTVPTPEGQDYESDSGERS